MRLVTIFFLVLMPIADVSRAQTSSSDVNASKSSDLGSARQKVFDALRRNDAAAANAAIDLAIAARTDDGGTDVSASEEYALLSFGLADLQDRPNARRLATLSIKAAERVEVKQNKAPSVRAALLAAHLYERVLRDGENARAAYKRVLALDPENVPAKEGIARIDLEKIVDAEKLKEQQLMQQRKNQLPDAKP